MSEEKPVLDQEHLLEHNYDGIQEYDNPLPRWWVVLFWVTIVFSPFYILFYHAGPGKLAIEAYNEDMIAYYDLQAQQFLAFVRERRVETIHTQEPTLEDVFLEVTGRGLDA